MNTSPSAKKEARSLKNHFPYRIIISSFNTSQNALYELFEALSTLNDLNARGHQAQRDLQSRISAHV